MVAPFLFLAGCGRDEVRVYPAPKDPPLAVAPADPHRMMGAGAGAAEPKPILWTVPPGWADKGASGMRAGSFTVQGTNSQAADISVIAMQTWNGQELDNVNRWRAQVGLQRITAEELPKNTTPVQIAGTEAPMFEMAGTPLDGSKPTRILVAVLPLPDVAWYFKMSGDDALVAEHKAAFVTFLASVHFGAAAPAGSPAPAPADSAGRPDADGGKPKWTVPAGWQEQVPGRMQTARFTAPGPNATQAETTFTVLSGTGGGMLPNVNRWRNQLGLPPVDEAGLAKMAGSLDLKAGTATVVDMTAETKQNRIVAAIVARGDATWFFRLSGPDAAVEAHKAEFLKFVQSAQ
jgi:hypothetical protein